MQVSETDLPGVHLIKPRVFSDSRGFFKETYQRDRFLEAGLPGDFIQDNHSHSTAGVLRGLHYQLKYPQGKLVSVLQGEIFDVAVDIRRDSPNFARWVGVVLSADNQQQLYIPPGFAHGFCVLSEAADVYYKCTQQYHPEDDFGIAWNDQRIGVQWPLSQVLLSDKDASHLSLEQCLVEDLLPAMDSG